MHPKEFALAAAALALAVSTAVPATAKDRELKVGFVSSFSGSVGVLGRAVDEGYQIAMDQLGGKIGGYKTTVLKADDEGKPNVGIETARKMVVQDKVDVIFGTATTVVVVPVAAIAARRKVPMIGPVSGPSMLAGARCSPYFFSTSWDNNLPSEAMGRYLQDQGVKSVYIFSANFQGGKDAIAGFKRNYKGKILGEVYTPFTAQDYNAEITQAAAAKPDAIFAFYPGNLATNFVTQLAQSGVMKTVPFYSASTIDPTTLPAIGNAAVGTYQTEDYNWDLPYKVNEQFVAAFEAKFHREPSAWAAHAYDGVMLLNAALKTVQDPSDSAALVKALETAKFDSLRGPDFKMNTNHFPIQNFYLLKTVEKDGKPVQVTQKLILKDQADSHVGECKMAQP